MAALATGLTILSDKKNLITHPAWCVIGVGSGLAFCYHLFAGGCMLALFSMSLWPYLLELLSHHSSALVLVVGMETYFILTSSSALVTGHDYMPGISLLLNERPVVLMLFSVTLIATGVQKDWMVSNDNLLPARFRRRSRHNSQISFFGSVWRRLSTINEESSSEEISDDDAFSTAKIDLEHDLPIMKDEESRQFLSRVQKG